MKHDCDIVRDLMPLCIDGTASDKSRQMVGEHVLECPPCMEIYQEMRAEVPREPIISKDSAPFGDTVKRLRKKRNKRRALGIIAGVIVGVMLVLLMGSGYTILTTDYARMADEKDYTFGLARRTNGQIIATHHNRSGYLQQARWNFNHFDGILQFYAVTPTIPLKTDRVDTPYMYSVLFWDNTADKLMISWGGENVEVKEVHLGAGYKGDGYLREIIYVQGNDIPMVDPAIDAAYDVVAHSSFGEYDSYSDYIALSSLVTVAPTPTPMATLTPKEYYEVQQALYMTSMGEPVPEDEDPCSSTVVPMPMATPGASAKIKIH